MKAGDEIVVTVLEIRKHRVVLGFEGSRTAFAVTRDDAVCVEEVKP